MCIFFTFHDRRIAKNILSTKVNYSLHIGKFVDNIFQQLTYKMPFGSIRYTINEDTSECCTVLYFYSQPPVELSRVLSVKYSLFV